MFRQSTKDKINGWGSVLRFVTPIMIALIGYFGKMAISDIKTSITNLDTHLASHLEYQKEMEIIVESRLTCLETLAGLRKPYGNNPILQKL